MKINKTRIAVIAAVVVLFSILVSVIFLYGRGGTEDDAQVKVGLVLTGTKHDGGWNEAHYKALAVLEEEMDFRLICRENIPETDDSIIAVIDEMAAEGASIICASGWGYGDSIFEVNEQYPDIVFLHCSGTEKSENVAGFFGRMYQARYLTGIAAGMRTQSHSIGYVASMPTVEVIRGINAFTLGVRSVDPEATVHVLWTNAWDNITLEKQLTDQLIDDYGADVVSYHQNTAAVCEEADARGVYSVGYHYDNTASFPDTCLTAAVWNWTDFYRSRIRECIGGDFTGNTYWDGYSEGAVAISRLSDCCAEGTAQAVEAAQERLIDGDWDVFFGPIYDNSGALRVEEGTSLSDDYLLNDLTWFVEGVDSAE